MNDRANCSGTLWAVTSYKAVAGGNWESGDWVLTVDPATSPTDPKRRFTNWKWSLASNGLDRGDGVICRNSDNQLRNYIGIAEIRDGTSNTLAVGEAVPRWSTHTWWYWFNGSTGTCGIPINYRRGLIDLQTKATEWQHNYSFFSQHTARGANFALADGSVTFLRDKIDYELYRRLACISDEQLATVPER
jgi:prepilin-type processing-associated H-X9-DG protein